jgi:hypothetical protein
MPGEPAGGPLFAVGIWRSGTSLLYALLNQHPQIGLLYEGDLPLLGPFFRVPQGRKGWPRRWEFWNGALHRHQLDAAGFPSGLHDQKAATRAIYQAYARRKGASIWGDKSPTYYAQLLRLAKQFPDARFLVIWRSPAGILDSMCRAAERSLWFRKRGMRLRALLGYREMKRQVDELVRRGVPVHEIDYEELTKDPVPVMRGICDFLRIPFDPKMTALADADRSAVPDGKHHALVMSESIVAGEKRPETLPAELEAKTRRYVNLWKKQTGGAWPRYSSNSTRDAGMPGIVERCSDRVLYGLLRGFDEMVLILYSFAPIGLLQNYRDRKLRRARLEQKTPGD